jgi:NAD(P) transhydrogenase
MADTYDLVVIGAGPGGQSAAELATFLGHSALMVERGSPGGTVTTTGGAPTKTLREVALSLNGGTTFAEALPALRARTIEACQALQQVIAHQIAARGIAYEQGTARLAPNRIVVIDRPDGTRREVAARAIVVATGSTPLRSEGIPFDDPDVYDSNEIFALRRVPKDIVIIGAGPVGVEFTTVFTALACR